MMSTVKEICQDVIDRVKARNFIAYNSHILSDGTGRILSTYDSVQSGVNNETCQCCAKGAILLSWIGTNNNFTGDDIIDIISPPDFNRNIPSELLEIFGYNLLDEIEVAFERAAFPWTDASNERIEFLGEKYKEDDLDDRLIHIMQDIIDDKF